MRSTDDLSTAEIRASGHAGDLSVSVMVGGRVAWVITADGESVGMIDVERRPDSI